MRLSFDHGTLVLADAPDLKGDRVPGLLWDPRVALFRAPAWRYPEVRAALRHCLPPLRDEVKPSALPQPASWNALALRPYQRAALLSWEISGCRGTIVLPTGSGKTQVAIAALSSAGARALCLVPTRALLEQWTSALGAAYRGTVGRLGDGQRDLQAITVSTFESAYRLMPRIGAQFELLIVDEAHHFGLGARDEALEMSIAPQRLGLTATPPSEPAVSRLADLIGPIVYQLTIADLAGTWLADFDLVTLQLGLSPAERAKYEADSRTFSELNRRFRRLDPHASWQEFVSAASQSPEGRAALRAWRRNRRLLQFTEAKAQAVGVLLARHRDSRTIVFTADNEAAYGIAREHLVMPITCDIPRAEREAALSAFREGGLRSLVSARVLNEGIDVPDADVAIIVSGTQGEREHVQRVGRLLRPVPGKRAVIYELVTRATSEARRATARRQALAPANVAAR
ncbi:MAG: DEAD/DEAH box helicase family protein [Pseudomonadota bacterium]